MYDLFSWKYKKHKGISIQNRSMMFCATVSKKYILMWRVTNWLVDFVTNKGYLQFPPFLSYIRPCQILILAALIYVRKLAKFLRCYVLIINICDLYKIGGDPRRHETTVAFTLEFSSLKLYSHYQFSLILGLTSFFIIRNKGLSWT